MWGGRWNRHVDINPGAQKPRPEPHRLFSIGQGNRSYRAFSGFGAKREPSFLEAAVEMMGIGPKRFAEVIGALDGFNR